MPSRWKLNACAKSRHVITDIAHIDNRPQTSVLAQPDEKRAGWTEGIHQERRWRCHLAAEQTTPRNDEEGWNDGETIRGPLISHVYVYVGFFFFFLSFTSVRFVPSARKRGKAQCSLFLSVSLFVIFLFRNEYFLLPRVRGTTYEKSSDEKIYNFTSDLKAG